MVYSPGCFGLNLNIRDNQNFQNLQPLNAFKTLDETKHFRLFNDIQFEEPSMNGQTC